MVLLSLVANYLHYMEGFEILKCVFLLSHDRTEHKLYKQQVRAQ